MFRMLFVIVYTAVTLVSSLSSAGAKAMDTGEEWDLRPYFKRTEARATLPGKLSFGKLPDNRFIVEFDETMGQMFTDLADQTGFDAEKIASSWPDMFYHLRWLYKIMPRAFNRVRDYILDEADRYEAEGDFTKMALYMILGAAVGLPTKVAIVAERDFYGPGLHAAWLKTTYGDGSIKLIKSKITYDENRGCVYGEGDSSSGIIGWGFNMNVDKGWAYTAPHPPMRQLGYMKLYDTLLLKTSDMVYVDTVRLKFPYQDRDWMLQMWKGRYFITTGGEVGMYNKAKDSKIDFYDATGKDAENSINMSFRIKVNETNEYLVDRPVMNAWWMTGFAVRPVVYGPKKITLESDVIPRDSEMYDALKTALDKEKVFYKEEKWDNPATADIVEETPMFAIVW